MGRCVGGPRGVLHRFPICAQVPLLQRATPEGIAAPGGHLPLDMGLACREALCLGFLLLWGDRVKTGVGGEKGTPISGGLMVGGGVCMASAGVQPGGGEPCAAHVLMAAPCSLLLERCFS